MENRNTNENGARKSKGVYTMRTSTKFILAFYSVAIVFIMFVILIIQQALLQGLF